MKFLKTQNLSKYGLTDTKFIANPYGRYVMAGQGGLRIPSGPQAARPQVSGVDTPGGANGYIRYNTDAGTVEAYVGGGWSVLGTAAALEFTPINSIEKGAANGVATLDAEGLIPEGQLPPMANDVVEVIDFNSLPSLDSADTGKIYVTVDNNFGYRWTGSAYSLVFSDSVDYARELIKNSTQIGTTAIANGGSAKIIPVTTSDGYLKFSVAPSVLAGETLVWNDVAKLDTDGFHPLTTNVSELGTSALRWQGAFVGAGSSATPTISFSPTNTVNTGIYSSAEGKISFSSGGSLVTEVVSTGIVPAATNTQKLGTSSLRWATSYIGAGAAATPSITFSSSTGVNTGIYSSTEGKISFSSGGTLITDIDSTGIVPPVTNTFVLGAAATRWKTAYVGAGAAATPTIAFSPNSTVNTGIYSSAEGKISFSSGGSLVTEVVSTGIVPAVTNTQKLGTNLLRWETAYLGAGAVGTPSITFSSSTGVNTGIYSSVDGTISFATSGALAVEIDSTALFPNSTGTLSIGKSGHRWTNEFLKAGTKTAPALSLSPTNTTNSGLYSPSEGVFNFSSGGNDAISIASTGITPAVTDTQKLGTAALRWNTIFLGIGSEAFPSIALSPTNTVNTGIYSDEEGVVSFTSGGVDAVNIDAAGIYPNVTETYKIGTATKRWKYTYLGAGAAATPSLSFSTDTTVNSGIYSGTNGILSFASAGANVFNVASTGIYPSNDITKNLGSTTARWAATYLGAGAAATPSLSFSPTNTVTTGLYSSAEGTISFSSGGVYAGQIAAGGNMTMVGNITANSDLRLKKDLTVIDNALAKVQQLTGYTYTRIDTGDRQTGIIAQDLEKVLPEAVLQNSEYKSVAYGNIVGLLIEAIKELKAEVNALKGA